MAQNAPSKIHTVTRAYLAAWAPPPAGVLRPVSKQFGGQKPKTPAAVGWTREWWGSDPVLNAACEQACSSLEGLVPPLLRDFDERWPIVDGHDRALLGQFIALHAVRTDASKERLEEARDESLERIRPQWESNGSKMPFERFAKYARTDASRAERLLKVTNKIASLVASMHWTLLLFEKPMIITSDHPVIAIPLLHGEAMTAVTGVPPGGWANVIEIRFPVSPRLLLVCSWHPGDESASPMDGHWNDAADTNGALSVQARRQWFHVPGFVPPFPPIVYRDARESVHFGPITPRLIQGHDAAAAERSPRRREVLAQLDKLIESQDDEMMFVARPQFRQAA